ncbi:hypothetical protein [Microvirga aerophila]|uniref:hypothetical protein n=1 Tax=Microvirga aerophila TaxID=670291 RepID=UPI0011BF5816|nr:hypothetical protein [Microvirga aerophila]
MWQTGFGVLKDVRQRPDFVRSGTYGELLQTVDDCGEVGVVCPTTQSRHQPLGKGLHVLLDVVAKERHPLEKFLLRRQVKACQSGFPPPLEMPLVTIWTVTRIPGWHVC